VCHGSWEVACINMSSPVVLAELACVERFFRYPLKLFIFLRLAFVLASSRACLWYVEHM
jgi:hypothetical protein